jgi:hypothetical protein
MMTALSNVQSDALTIMMISLQVVRKAMETGGEVEVTPAVLHPLALPQIVVVLSTMIKRQVDRKVTETGDEEELVVVAVAIGIVIRAAVLGVDLTMIGVLEDTIVIPGMITGMEHPTTGEGVE